LLPLYPVQTLCNTTAAATATDSWADSPLLPDYTPKGIFYKQRRHKVIINFNNTFMCDITLLPIASLFSFPTDNNAVN
jgi:hypothetical protein